MNDTISVNEVMDKIGYGPSPDNEADLRRHYRVNMEDQSDG